MITSIVGAQFGDEGKGKITDYLTSELDSCTVVRWSGGSNAGHTIQVYEREYKLKLVPSGALNKNATLIKKSFVLRTRDLIPTHLNFRPWVIRQQTITYTNYFLNVGLI